MKQFKIYSFVTFFAYWILYVLFSILYRVLVGLHYDVIQQIINGLILSIIGTSLTTIAMYEIFKPKIKFLESKETQIPKFWNHQKKSILIDTNFSFEEARAKIADLYEITYEDKSAGILKFKTKPTFFSWGVGTILQLNTGNNILITSFPFSNYTKKGKEDTFKANDKIEKEFLHPESEYIS